MNVLFLFLIIYIELILGSFFDIKTFILNTEKNLEMLSYSPNNLKKEKKIKELKLVFEPLIKKIYENHEIEIEKEKDFYSNRNLVLPYMKKVYDGVKYFVDNINMIGAKNCNDIVKIFLYLKEDVKFYNFWLQANDFLIKYKNSIFYLDTTDRKNENLKKFFIYNRNEFLNMITNFKKFNLKDSYVFICGFKKETNGSVVNKFEILKKIINVKNNMNKIDYEFIKDLDFEFENLKLYFYRNKNFTLCLEYQTVDEVKLKYDCEMKKDLVKLVDNKKLKIIFIEVIKSMFELEEMARTLDNIRSNHLRNSNCKSVNHYEVYGNDFFKNVVNKFKENLAKFFNECDGNEYSFVKIPSTYILNNIIEQKLETEINYEEKVENVFKEILNDESFGKAQFEHIYNKEIFESAEKYMKIYHITENFLNSYSILEFDLYINTSEANSKLSEYLNYKKQIIYDLIKLIKICLNSRNPYEIIFHEIKQKELLDILLHQFIPICFIPRLHSIFEKKFQNSIYTSVSFEDWGIVESFLSLKYKFSNQMKQLIKDMEINKNMSIFKLTTTEIICMSIIIDILKIVADNIIEERDYYLREWENDNEIPVSFKNIFDLCEKFIKSY